MICYNHPQKNASSFCFSCGNWFCNDCLKQTFPQPLCKNCSSKNNLTAVPQLEQFIDVKALNPRVVLRIIGITSLLIWLVLGFTLHPFFYLFSLCSIVPFIISFSLKKERTKKGKLNTNQNKIADAQVNSLINKYHKITYQKLADATNSYPEAAKKKLNQMVVESLLEIDSTNMDLMYSKKE